jgi:hypothetical protein
MYSLFGAFIVFSFLGIIRDKDTFFNCPARIEAFFIIFLISTFSPAKTADRFFAIFSVSVKFLA